jgi:hypothetical protein
MRFVLVVVLVVLQGEVDAHGTANGVKLVSSR